MTHKYSLWLWIQRKVADVLMWLGVINSTVWDCRDPNTIKMWRRKI